jgi:hypothetical protein
MSYKSYKLNIITLSIAAILLLQFTTPQLAISSGDGHSHETKGLHFSHPLITESPSPDTKIRLDYFFLDVDGEIEDEELGEEGEGPNKFKESTILLELEYAFTRNISIEADIPYTFLNVNGGSNENHFNNIEIGIKTASFILEQYGILLGGGIEFGLPTGKDRKGIGSDNIFEIEPFADFGYKYKDLEVVGFLSLGFPVNQKGDQDEGDELGYNLSMLYHIGTSVQAILEFDGETVLNGEEDGESVLNIDPGIKVAPFRNKDIKFGFGASFPLTDDEEFEYRLIGSVFYHMPSGYVSGNN